MTNRDRLLAAAIVLVVAGLEAVAARAEDPAADLVLIVNKENPVATIGENEARDIFLGKKAFWPSGERIRLSIQRDRELHDAFARKVVHLSAQQYGTHWKRLLFTGRGVAPARLLGGEEVKRWVASEPGAIGYIERLELDGTVKPLATW